MCSGHRSDGLTLKNQYQCDARRGVERAHYRSRYFSAAWAYTSGSNSFGLCASSFRTCCLSGVAPGNWTLVISGFAPPLASLSLDRLAPWADVVARLKRPSSDGSMSRMRSPKDLCRTARVNGALVLSREPIFAATVLMVFAFLERRSICWDREAMIGGPRAEGRSIH